jgi:hypothetical protein
VAGTSLTSPEQTRALIAGAAEELVLRWRRAGRSRELRIAPELALAAAPPASRAAGPPARAVLPLASLDGAGLAPEARLVSIEGAPVADQSQAERLLRRHRPPWLVHVQEEARRYFALVDGPRP